jgi:TonB family protein
MLEGVEMIERVRGTNFRRLGYCSLLALCFAFPGQSQEISRKLLKRVEAQYPSVLKKRGIGGTVRLKLHVKADGSVKEVEVLGGSAILADSAVAAVKQWKFAEGGESAFDVSIVFDPNSQ